MTTPSSALDFEQLLKLRLIVARHGEMDRARWWNTNGLLGRKGALLMSRGFPRTHRFAQARVVFAVASARCAQVFDPPGCMTLWKLPAELEDQFDARWSDWLDQREHWAPFMDQLHEPGELIATLRAHGLIEPRHEDALGRMQRCAEGRAVLLPGACAVDDETITLLAAGFARGQTGKLALPYARLER